MGYGNVPFELGQLLITRQIIANGMEIDFSMLSSLGIFDKKNDGDWSATTFTKDIVFLFTTLLTLRSRIPLQVIHIDRREFFGQTLAHAVSTVGVDPAGIGDETNDPLFADAV